jgi:N-dimethylarginine dimethylaminohydrolase
MPKEKYSDKEIAYIAKKRGFDYEGALKEGYSPQEVIVYLETVDQPQEKDDVASPVLELLMCPPKYLSAKTANNKWMKDMPAKEREVNVDRAMAEFHEMYSLISQDCMVYLLPPKEGLQDETYISNAGVVLPHLPKKTMILSNFTAKGRTGEEKQLKIFAEMMGYKTYDCPFKWEGEAETKWLHDDIYAGGYGTMKESRTDEKALDWISDTFGAKIIKIEERDPLAYHLDCSIFPLSQTKAIFAKDLMQESEIKKLEKVVELIPIGKDNAQYGLTNLLRVGSIIYAGTYIKTLKKDHEEYPHEKSKNEKIEKICRDAGLSLVFVQLSEANKSGAMLSCCCLHLSYSQFFDMDK